MKRGRIGSEIMGEGTPFIHLLGWLWQGRGYVTTPNLSTLPLLGHSPSLNTPTPVNTPPPTPVTVPLLYPLWMLPPVDASGSLLYLLLIFCLHPVNPIEDSLWETDSHHPTLKSS